MYEIIVLLRLEIFYKQLKEYEIVITISSIVALEFFIDSDAFFALKLYTKCRDPPSYQFKKVELIGGF